MAIATVNPATGQTLRMFEALSDADLDDRIARAARAFETYRRTGFAARAGWLRASAGLLDLERDDLAAMMTTEMGKTLTEARAEVRKCARVCRFYAEHGQRMLADEPADQDAVGAVLAYTRYRPLGPVLAVMPWNFPLWQVLRFAAPALMSGNVGLLKHASNVPQTALAIEALFRRAGFPEGVFQTLLVGADAVDRILRDDRVRAATLTGSERAGRAVGAVAGGQIKPTVLELGGSDPFVVMPSADLARAASTAVTSRALNSGQSCIAAKRFIVHQDVAEPFERLFVERMAALRVGDPMDESTEVGPLASAAQRAEIEDLVEDAVRGGARVLCGGHGVDGPGYFYPPTVLTGVTEQMRMYREEIFGPVAQVHRVRDIGEAIELANATAFGLGASVWTDDPSERDQFIRDVEAGAVFVNGMTASFPELPFGGVKNSGYGRELSASGIRAFCNVQAVWVGTGR
ncbi:MAG: NADP-dependent succinic semialdehyde dehydrogenase [Dactylosporangium sp.]|nr:NADP-dependent succinic semialdehyde dehydrogenase [Dactylosporangium sp.]NNJ62803.1 NADP-dependent succinic semialdehyde dehydrogenase [Dactylosporangium sp.]